MFLHQEQNTNFNVNVTHKLFFFFERENYPSFKYSQLGIKMDGPAWDSPVCDINWALRHMKEEKR